MESAAVAQVCWFFQTPLLVIRALSDNADEAAFEELVVKQFDVSEYCATAAAIVLDVLRTA